MWLWHTNLNIWLFLEKVISMGVEICSRSATECNFLLKLSIHSDMDDLALPTSFYRQLTWTHRAKSLKLICHSEKPTFPCPFSAFATRHFPTLEKSTGRRRGPSSLWPPAGRLELPAHCPGGAGLRWGSLPWYFLCFGLMSSAGTLCSRITLNTCYSFAQLGAPKCLWAHLSFSVHRTWAFCQSPHSSPISWQVAALSLRGSHPFTALFLHTALW